MDSQQKPIDRLLGKLSFMNRGMAPYLFFAAVFFLVNALIDPLTDGFIMSSFRILVLIGVVCIIALGFYLWAEGRLTYERAAMLVMLVGVLMRIGYSFYTSMYTRQHDVGYPDGSGHWAHIVFFANNLGLPDTNHDQFYHPPLHHMLAGWWFWFNERILQMEMYRNFESVQYLTAIFSSCAMMVSHRIFKQLKLKGPFLLAATSIVALHPTLFILGGSINNDMLAALLYLAAFLRLLHWWEEQSAKNTALLALCVGLGMMAKLNDATLAFVIAPFFLIKLFGRSETSKGRLILSFLLFGVIAIPLGMWQPIRNLLLFEQPLGYVKLMEYGSDIDRSAYSVFERVFSVSFSQLFERLYPDPKIDYNLPVYVLKTSLFGEWYYNADMASTAIVLLALNVLLTVASLVAMVFTLVKVSGFEYEKEISEGEGNRAGYWMLFLMWLVQMVSFVAFYITLPFSCSMDFRYIVPTIVCGAGFIFFSAQWLSNRRPKTWARVRRVVFVPTALFCLFSVFFFTCM